MSNQKRYLVLRVLATSSLILLALTCNKQPNILLTMATSHYHAAVIELLKSKMK